MVSSFHETFATDSKQNNALVLVLINMESLVNKPTNSDKYYYEPQQGRRAEYSQHLKKDWNMTGKKTKTKIRTYIS